MSFKTFLFLTLVLLWVAEPFLALTALQPKDPRAIYPEGVGSAVVSGDMCCSHYSSGLCSSQPHGLYAANCTPDHARNFFFAQSATKWNPQARPSVFRTNLVQTVAAGFEYLPCPTFDSLSPPPKSETLS